jgi:hypothetical protein
MTLGKVRTLVFTVKMIVRSHVSTAIRYFFIAN